MVTKNDDDDGHVVISIHFISLLEHLGPIHVYGCSNADLTALIMIFGLSFNLMVMVMIITMMI